MRRLLVVVASLLSWTTAQAQGSISGTFFAPDTSEYVIIACHINLDADCDEELSGYAQVTGAAGGQPFEIPGLTTGYYLLISWLDANGNGEAEEDELVVLMEPGGDPALLSPPASGIEFRLPGASTPGTPATPAPPATRGPLGDLPGIWQQTRASSGDYQNLATGYTFSATSGFSTKLIIDEGAGYYMAYYSSGYSPSCFVTYYEQSTGTLTIEGSRLVLHPNKHRLDVTGCENPGSRDLELEPIVYDFQLEQFFDYEGMRSYRLNLEGGPHPLALTLLHHDPLMPGYQPPQPADFVLGDTTVFQDFIGTWSPDRGSRLDFYNAATGEFYIPELDGSHHLWLRLSANEYELARSWRNYNREGVCEKDLLYYERGVPLSSITEAPKYEGDSAWGHIRFSATKAHLIVNIHDCDQFDQLLQYDLVPQVSYYGWMYHPESHEYMTIPEFFRLDCPWERSEWQFMVCPSNTSSISFTRR